VSDMNFDSMSKVGLSPPQPISQEHVLDDFDCGQPSLNEWLSKRALKNERDASRTFVVCDGKRVVGYYALATGSVFHLEAPGKIQRNMPNPIPVMVLGRLAVDLRYKKMGIGKGLLKDAILRADKVNENVGFRALMVHALDEVAKAFYEGNGFMVSPSDELMLFLSLPAIRP
jgi:GNAT superfamily N-acetyltransferase